MRDYNNIQFRSPTRKPANQKMVDHPLAAPEEKSNVVASQEGSSFSTVATTTTEGMPAAALSPSPARNGHLSAADALAVRRDGAEATIFRLRNALEESSAHDSTSKTALAKSDAVILELRSSVRQLKRQLEKVEEEKQNAEEDKEAMLSELRRIQNSRSNSKSIDDQSADARDARVGELQVQLDRAHAQLLTSDMVRKELEDTLEAEQYTWELRVQDQERTIQQLQQECATLAEDLDQCRTQWKEAEDGWTKEVQELQSKLETARKEAHHWKSMQQDNQEVGVLKERLLTLEQERAELQNCLDEALKELEAVDEELQRESVGKLREENKLLKEAIGQNENRLAEPLRHVYRWLLERDGVEENGHTSPRDARELVAAIQSHLESLPENDKDLVATKKKVSELESQLSVYRGDLQAREESSAELRGSLKEAVSLLKPLQDAVARADRDKARMQEKIDRLQGQTGAGSEKDIEIKKLKHALNEKDNELDKLREEIESLEVQLSKEKLMAANSVLEAQKAPVARSTDSVSRAREEVKAKRLAENNLKQLLQSAQTRFNTLQRQNEEVEALNSELEGRLKETRLDSDRKPADFDVTARLEQSLVSKTAKLLELESETKVLRGELAKKDVELRNLGKEMREAKDSDTGEAETQLRDIRNELTSTVTQLNEKKQAEKALNKSLKEALGLLKPLQMHLEEAEQEKREMAKQMRSMRQSLGDSMPVHSGSARVPNDDHLTTIRHLEETVKQLELENSQLQEALDDMSQSINVSHVSGMSSKADSKVREEFVEMKSRYQVTKGKLEDTRVENQALVEGLKKRDLEENEMVEELNILRAKLRSAETELENAKFIATSALVKVEELTMAHVGQLSRGSNGQHERLYKEKAKEFERVMSNARQQRAKVPY